MSDQYLAALWQEIAAWQRVAEALSEQRQAILHRKSQQLWEVQERLQEALRLAVIARNETLRRRPPERGPEVATIEEQVARMHLQVRDGVRLNHELLKDICTYLEMIREVVFPHTLAGTYEGGGRRREVAEARVGRVA